MPILPGFWKRLKTGIAYRGKVRDALMSREAIGILSTKIVTDEVYDFINCRRL